MNASALCDTITYIRRYGIHTSPAEIALCCDLDTWEVEDVWSDNRQELISNLQSLLESLTLIEFENELEARGYYDSKAER